MTAGEDFYKLSKALKRAGRGDLRRELNKGLRQAADPLIPVAREAFRAELPHRGGLNEFVASKPMRIAIRTGVVNAGVVVVVSKEDPRFDTEGRLVHPVFGRKGSKVVQDVKPGIFSGALAAKAPDIRQVLEQSIEDFATKLVHDLGG